MITVKNFIFNAFQVNSFVLSDETGECIVVDAACYSQKEKDIIDQYISDNGLTVKKIVNTHCHVDHVLGARHLVEKYNPSFEIHDSEVRLLTDAPKHGVVFGFIVEEPPVATGYLSEGTDVTFGKSSLKVIHVPGHSPGSVAFYCPEQNFIIVGDVLFRGSIGRTDLPGGNYDQLMDSILSKLMALPDDTQVWPGHGPATTIHEEALSNPFLS
jgi:Zn-dependent hydrolases, including glyoxylases